MGLLFPKTLTGYSCCKLEKAKTKTKCSQRQHKLMHFFKDWLWWNDEKFPEDSEGKLRRLRNKMEWRFHILLLWAEQSDPWEFYSTYFNGKCHIFWLLEGKRGTLLHNIKKKKKPFPSPSHAQLQTFLPSPSVAIFLTFNACSAQSLFIHSSFLLFLSLQQLSDTQIIKVLNAAIIK